MQTYSSPLVNPYEQYPELQVEFCDLCRLSERRGLNANALTAENVKQELAGTIVLVDGLAFFLALDVLQVLIEEVGAVHWATLGLGVELGREDGAGLVHHTLVASIIEVYEVLLEVAGKSAGVNSVAVVLGGLAININIILRKLNHKMNLQYGTVRW